MKIFPDGRDVCGKTAAGRAEYTRRRDAMYDRDGGTCCICGKRIHGKHRATFEHWEGRGMGGGHRDDRIEKDGRPYNGVAHAWCNAQKGSKRRQAVES